MDILFLLIPLSVMLAVLIGVAFWRAIDTGQFDDLDAPSVRILADDDSSVASFAMVARDTASKDVGHLISTQRTKREGQRCTEESDTQKKTAGRCKARVVE